MSNDRVLKPLFSKHLKKRKVTSFDIETYDKENKFYMCGFQTEEKYYAYYDKFLFIKELTKQKYYGSFYHTATNLEFDFFGIFGKTKEWKDFEILMRGGRYIACMRKKKKQKQIFIDTMNFFMCSLSTLGKIINLPKLESPKCILNYHYGTPFNFKKFNFKNIKEGNFQSLSLGYARKPYTENELLELEIYNKRDCEITYKFMEFLQDGVNSLGGNLKITSASTSLDLFRRKYLRKTIIKEDKILNLPDGETVNDFIFESYFGGRTEVFVRGGIKPIKEGEILVRGYDINSLYPSVMRNIYPNPESVKRVYENTQKYIHRFEGVSEVEIYCPYMHKPLLPVKVDGKLCFPIGYFKGVYTHIELRKALQIGYKILRVNQTVYYKRTFKPFEEYVLDLYETRLKYKKEGNPAEQITKLFLNSLYGKWGSKKFSETKIFNIDDLDESEFEYWFENENNDFKVDTKDNIEFIANRETRVRRPYVIPILASYTTAYARLLMYDYIAKYDPLYMDTDSVFIFGEMEVSKELGKMSLDYECEEVIFVKPKMYMYGKDGKFKIRVKGVSKMDSYKFMNILKGNSVSYQKFMKTKEGLKRGIVPNSVMEVEKYLSLEDNKRDWKGKTFDFNKLQYSEPLEVDLLCKREEEKILVLQESKNDTVSVLKQDFKQGVM